MPHPDNIFVAIAGNIGVGKTTLTGLLHRRFQWRPFFETVAENPYLADFYDDMQRWAFHSQIFFLTQRLKMHLELQEWAGVCVQDRTIYEDAEIFAQNLFESGCMTGRDFQSYQDLYQTLAGSLKRPDLVVYLKASPWTLVSRIRKRGREYERDIDREYLLKLNLAYNRWVKRIAEKWSVLVVDTDDYDMERDVNWLESIVEAICERVATAARRSTGGGDEERAGQVTCEDRKT